MGRSGVVGTPSLIDSKFLISLWKANLITLEGEHKEDYVLEVPHINKRVCYVNHGDEPH